MTLIEDLLIENRFWTFWASDWSKRVNVLWKGKTKFSTVEKAIKKKYFSKVKYGGYERQITLRNSDEIFA